MITTLFTGGRVRTLAATTVDAVDDWLLTRGSQVVASGRRGDEPRAHRVVYLGGAALVPAFCDPHVHLPTTGIYAAGMNFRGERRAAAILGAFSERARSGHDILFGGNFEDPPDGPITRHDLDRAVGGRAAMLARADMHSCIVSTSLLDELDLQRPGVDRDDAGRPTGYLREQAAAAAWTWFDRSLPRGAHIDAIRNAVSLAYSRGISSVHEMLVVEWRGWSSLEILLDAVSDVALDVVVYVATDDVERVARLGLGRIGGDYFLDGSFGSHTAWLSEPYSSASPPGAPPCGTPYREDAALFDFFYEAHSAGLQTGVHAIGDAAIDQALRVWEEVARKLGGSEPLRPLRHRIEHFECARDDHIARAARLGLGISIQPAFDRFWGGPGGMYARRIGWERARGMNRFASMLRAGLVLGAGSDSTVTPMDPMLQMAALRSPHVLSERVSAADALRLVTTGAHALARRDGSGVLAPGRRADFTVLDRDPVTVPADELDDVEVVDTWIGGRRVWPPEDAEVA